MIDFAEAVPVDLFETLQDAPGIATNVGGSFSFSQFSFNQCYVQDACEGSTGHPALKDQTVREAMAMASTRPDSSIASSAATVRPAARSSCPPCRSGI